MITRDTIGTILAGIGIFDTIILMDETYNNSGICGGDTSTLLGYPIDCGHILTSEYSKIMGIPLSLLGFIFYVTMFILFNMYSSKRTYISKLLLAGSVIGLLASIYFVYLQLFIINAICLYCMGSATTSTLIFITMITSYKILLNPVN